MSAIRSPVPPNAAEEPVVSSALARCLEAFARDLPELLETHPYRWVAYVDGTRLRLANTQTELYRQCLYDLDLPHETFIVCQVVPESNGTVEYTPR
jgi:hypothetical protein